MTPTMIRLLMPDGRVQPMVVEDYLRGVVPVEMEPAWPKEALKAQAVAARSYALAMAQSSKHTDEEADLCTEQHCQAYRKERQHPAADEAIRQTAGQVLRYGGPVALYKDRLAYTHYSAGCGGHTLSSAEWPVINRAVPYLQGVPCPCGMPVKGNSHRVGMCQHGAEVMARNGATYDRILAHYYQDTYLDPATSLPINEDEGDATELSSDSPILGTASGRKEQVARYLKRILPDDHEYTDQDVDLILGYYWQYAPAAGVDPYLAVIQSIYDTGSWQSPDAARPHRNPAKLGQGSAPGGVQSFKSWDESVQAHVAHLKAQGEGGRKLRDLYGDEYANNVVAKAQEVARGEMRG